MSDNIWISAHVGVRSQKIIWIFELRWGLLTVINVHCRAVWLDCLMLGIFTCYCVRICFFWAIHIPQKWLLTFFFFPERIYLAISILKFFWEKETWGRLQYFFNHQTYSQNWSSNPWAVRDSALCIFGFLLGFLYCWLRIQYFQIS